MAFQLTDFSTVALDTESEKYPLSIESGKALLDVETYGSALDAIGSAFDESMRVYGNLITASSDINFDSRHLSFAREHLETIFTHYGLGKDKVDLEVGRPTLNTETVYYLSREEVEGSSTEDTGDKETKDTKKEEGILTKIKNGIVAFFKWIWDAIKGFFKAIGRFFSNLFGKSKDKEKKAEEAVARYEKLEQSIQEKAETYGFEDPTHGQKYKLLVDTINGMVESTLKGANGEEAATQAARFLTYEDRAFSGRELHSRMHKFIAEAKRTTSKIVVFNGEIEKHVRLGVDALVTNGDADAALDKLKNSLSINHLTSLIVIGNNIEKKDDETTLTIGQIPTGKKAVLTYKVKDGVVTGIKNAMVEVIDNKAAISAATKFKVSADDIGHINSKQWGKLYGELDRLGDDVSNCLALCEKTVDKVLSYSVGKTKMWKPSPDSKAKAEQITSSVRVLGDVYRNYFSLFSSIVRGFFIGAGTIFSLVGSAEQTLEQVYKETDGRLDEEAISKIEEIANRNNRFIGVH
jgi:hypothetical protein|nr:MAG TPA: hypothetical protein [Bacteriophage sp.]